MARCWILTSGLLAALVSPGSAFAPSLSTLGIARRFGRAVSIDARSRPTSDVLRTHGASKVANLRMDSKGSATEEFWTRPRTTNANWGIFFEVVAKDRPIWITGIRAGGHSFADHNEYMRMKIRVLSTQGSAVGKELDQNAWALLGEADNFNLPRVEVGQISPIYTPLPFKTVHIPANSGRAFCIHTDKKNGLALRRKLNFDSNNLEDPYFREWTDGVTDESNDFKLIAGLSPGEKLFTDVSSANNARAFVGVIEYQLKEPSK